MQDLAAIESAEREFLSRMGDGGGKNGAENEKAEHERRTASASPSEYGLVMEEPAKGEKAKENDDPAAEGAEPEKARKEEAFARCREFSVDAAAEAQGAQAYVFFQGAAVLGQFLSKFESLNVMCTFDFTREGLHVSLLDRGKACQVRVFVPKDACLAYALREDTPSSAIVSTKALKRCAAASEKMQTLTLALSGNGETLTWRLRPGARAGSKPPAGRDEQFTLRCKEPMDEDDGGVQSGNSIRIERALCPPMLSATLDSKEFGVCVDRAYKAQDASMVVSLQASTERGFSFATPGYSACISPALCEFAREPPLGRREKEGGQEKTLSVPFSLVYLQLLAGFRDGSDAVKVTLPLQKKRRQTGKRKRAEECQAGDEGDPASDGEQCYPPSDMPLQGTFFGRNARPEDGRCVRAEVILFRREDPERADEGDSENSCGQ